MRAHIAVALLSLRGCHRGLRWRRCCRCRRCRRCRLCRRCHHGRGCSGRRCYLSPLRSWSCEQKMVRESAWRQRDGWVNIIGTHIKAPSAALLPHTKNDYLSLLASDAHWHTRLRRSLSALPSLSPWPRLFWSSLLSVVTAVLVLGTEEAP